MAPTSAPSRPKHAQKFLFVDLSEAAVSTPHSQVLSHVRHNYHRRRKKEEFECLHDSTAVSKTARGARFPLSNDEKSDTGREKPSAGVNSTVARSEGDANGRRQERIPQTSRHRQSPPILGHEGSADPFNAYAIKIDPQINEVISFYRDHTLPAQYHIPSHSKWVSSANARLDWEICISTLQQEDLASAFIARAATVAAVFKPGLRPLAMRYRLRSIQQLRVKLKLLNRDSISHGWSDSFLLQIIMLQKAEIVERNLTAAKARAMVLQHLFQERQRIVGSVEYTILQYALWSESQPLWTAALKELEAIPEWIALRTEAADGLDGCVEGPELKEFYISRRTTLATWLYFAFQGLPVRPLTMLWLTTTATVQQGRMIKHYLHAGQQARVARQEHQEETPFDAQYWYTQQYLILAEFLWTHHTSYKMEIGGIDLFDIAPRFLRLLRAALEHDLEPSKYDNAKLWALFVGAHTEWSASRSKHPQSTRPLHDQKTAKNVSRKPELNDWFRRRLAMQARKMGLVAWPDFRGILQGFNHADVIQPLGAKLLTQLLDVH